MAKTIKNIKHKKGGDETFLSKFSIEDRLPQKYHTLTGILLIALVFLIFFSPMYFGGKTFQSGDILTSYSFKNYVKQESEHLWNPYIFCGMPSAMSFGPSRWYDFFSFAYNGVKNSVSQIASVPYAAVTFHLFILALTTFLFMRFFKAGLLISLLVSLVTVFSTGIIVFVYIGHVTKLAVLAFYPLLFLLLLKMQKEIKLIHFILLIIGIHLLLEPLHVQIIFYTFFSIGIYFIYYLFHYLKAKDHQHLMNLLKSAGVFVAALVIALLMSYDNYMQTYEYTPYSTRGTKGILENQTSQKEQSDFYDYATSWSFSPGEVLTFIVPSFYGFGNSTYYGELSNFQSVPVNTYFGQMPFVDVPMYMGVIIFFLGLISIIINWKLPFVRFLTILISLSLLISFGKTFSPIFNLMFYYFPFFDKFRVPSMILVLVQISFPVLAGLSLMRFKEMLEEKEIKWGLYLKRMTIIFGAVFIVSVLLNSSLSDWFKNRIIDSGAKGERLKPIYDYMASMFTTDLFINLALIALVCLIIYFFIKKKISFDTLTIFILALSLFDLMRIDLRAENYINNPEVKDSFQKPSYVQEIQAMKDKEPFRLLNLKQDGTPGSFNSNQDFHVYFLLEDFYGYSGIKPRSYQDFIDVVGPANKTLWRMLNVKYIVTEKPVNFPGLKEVDINQHSVLYINQNALPRVYFIDWIATEPALDFLEMVKRDEFDPQKVGFLENGTLKVEKPDSSAFIHITKYSDEEISLNVKASGNNFLFVGDTYFPKGWEVKIDGEIANIYKIDHGFMGIVVPKGTHKVNFIYAPKSYYIGKNISLTLNSFLLIGLLFAAFTNYKKSKKDDVALSE